LVAEGLETGTRLQLAEMQASTVGELRTAVSGLDGCNRIRGIRRTDPVQVTGAEGQYPAVSAGVVQYSTERPAFGVVVEGMGHAPATVTHAGAVHRVVVGTVRRSVVGEIAPAESVGHLDIDTIGSGPDRPPGFQAELGEK